MSLKNETESRCRSYQNSSPLEVLHTSGYLGSSTSTRPKYLRCDRWPPGFCTASGGKNCSALEAAEIE